MDNNEAFSNTLDILIANTNLIEVLTIIIVIGSIIAIMIYVAVKQAAKDGNCNSLKALYSNESNVRPFLQSKQLTYTISDTEYDTRLRDLYVKASYNSCSAGNYKDDWVSTCALNEVLKQGCRFIDFEIYSVNHKPVVATSTTTDYFTKETWNSISFENVTKIIKNNAFSSDYVPNSTDPLLIHLRFKSNDILMYNKLAKIVQADLDSYTLDTLCKHTNYIHTHTILWQCLRLHQPSRDLIFAKWIIASTQESKNLTRVPLHIWIRGIPRHCKSNGV